MPDTSDVPPALRVAEAVVIAVVFAAVFAVVFDVLSVDPVVSETVVTAA